MLKMYVVGLFDFAYRIYHNIHNTVAKITTDIGVVNTHVQVISDVTIRLANTGKHFALIKTCITPPNQ